MLCGREPRFLTEFARRGLKRKGLELLGVIPHQSILTNPTLDQVRDGQTVDVDQAFDEVEMELFGEKLTDE